MGIDDTFDFAVGSIVQALGDEVVWKPGDAEETTIRAVFGDGFERVQSGDIRISSRSPEILVRASDLPSEPARGDEVRVRGTLFEVATPKSDAEDVSWTLVLKRSA